MITKIIRILGILVLTLFSITSIVISMMERDIDLENTQKILAYPSFFEDRFFDYRMRANLDPNKVEKRIVLAKIDDDSIKSIGRFPWSRSVWAKVIRKLNTFDARVLSFDVFFSEPELACNAESPDVDMANAIAEFKQKNPKNGIVLPYSLNTYGTEAFNEVPDSLYNFIVDTKQNEGINLSKNLISKTIYPLKIFLDKEVSLGYIQATEDADGIFRHYQVVANVDDLYFPSMAMMTYQIYTGERPVLELFSEGAESLSLTKNKVQLNKKGETKIRWTGGENSFPAVSIKDIIAAPDGDPKMKKVFSDNIVYIGSTAFGAHDLRHTPIDPMLPGVYNHMNMTNMLLNNYFFQHKDKSIQYSWAMLITGTLLMIIVQIFGNAILDLFAVVFLSLGLYFLDRRYFVFNGYEIKLFFTLFSVIACYSWTTFLNFYLASKEKKKIRGTFSHFVSPAVVEKMLSNPDMVKVGGEKKNITVFFSDVRDFTTISEKLTPEQLSTCLNQYMGVMTNIIFDSNGTLDKYIGDAIVAFWGAPLDVQNHAYHAVKAAVKMMDILPDINESFKKQGFPLFKHGVGLNTGDCSVGNMGSDKIFQYTALGDNMNLGARLESLCKYYGVQINISEFTKNAIPEDMQKEFTFRILDKVRVKGKTTAVTIYEVLHTKHLIKNDLDAQNGYEQAFNFYQTQKFQDAIYLLKPICEKYPEDKPSKRIKEICEEFLVHPPGEQWDGVFTHTTKG